MACVVSCDTEGVARDQWRTYGAARNEGTEIMHIVNWTTARAAACKGGRQQTYGRGQPGGNTATAL